MVIKKLGYFHYWLWAVLLIVVSSQPVAADEQVSTIAISNENATVYDENHNGEADLEGDTWVFDQNADDLADLIIVFRQETHPTAMIYDDANGDRKVDFSTTNNGVQVEEPHWRIKVESRDDSWYLPNGEPNWNLDISVDSGFELIDADVHFALSDERTTEIAGRTAIDGTPELKIHYWDTNQDGLPDYEYNNVNLTGWNDAVIVNKATTPHIQPTHRFPWLSILQMDWELADISKILHLIPTRHAEDGYFFYFNQPTKEGQVSFALENPFAFYDLQGDQDGVSELKLRAVTVEYDRRRSEDIFYNEFRYSWSQDTTDHQRYRLFVMGRGRSTQVHEYPKYPISHLAYEEFPSFVLSHPWEGVAFAEYESEQNRLLAEGIYENLLFTPAWRQHVLRGSNEELPPYLPIYLGLREEYKLTGYQRQPRVYFSPVDQRLHLIEADEGIIILSANSFGENSSGFDFADEALQTGELQIERGVRYSDTDDDGYMDTWSYIENDVTQAQLVLRSGAALLASNGSITIKRLPAKISPAAWEATPPTTQEEWEQFYERLNPTYENRPSMDDLAGMFEDLPGEVEVVIPAELKQVSANSQQLVVHLNTSEKSSSDQLLLPPTIEEPIAAGEYVLRDQEDSFGLEAPQLPNMQLSQVTIPTSSGAEDEQLGMIEFSVENNGTSDVEVAEVLVQEESSSGVTTLFEQQLVVPALDRVDFRIPWFPATAGMKTILVTVSDPSALGNNSTLQERVEFDVSGSTLSTEALFLSNARISVLTVVAILLALLVILGTFLFTNTAKIRP